MKRHLLEATASLLLLLALAAPVAAWDSVGVTITGAGGTAIGGTAGAVVDPLLVGPVLGDRPAGDLGPRFEISFAYGGRTVATEDLYPYAPGGPVAYAASAGSLVGHPYSAGWRQAPPAILQVFVSWGLAAAPAVAAAAPAAPATASSSGLAPALVLGIGVLLALVGLALRTRIASGIGIRLGRRGIA
jgi:hypothetical protein